MKNVISASSPILSIMQPRISSQQHFPFLRYSLRFFFFKKRGLTASLNTILFLFLRASYFSF